MQRANEKVLMINSEMTTEELHNTLISFQGKIQVPNDGLPSNLIEAILGHLQKYPLRKFLFRMNFQALSSEWISKIHVFKQVLLEGQNQPAFALSRLFQTETVSHNLAFIKNSIESTLAQIDPNQNATAEPKAKRQKVDSSITLADEEKIKVYALILTQYLEIKALKQEMIHHLLLLLTPSQRSHLSQFIKAVLNQPMQIDEARNGLQNADQNHSSSNAQLSHTHVSTSFGSSSVTTISSEPSIRLAATSTSTPTSTQIMPAPVFVFGEDGFSQEFDNPHLSTIQPNDTKFRFKDVLGAIKSCQINFDQVTVKLNFQNPALSQKITRILQINLRDKALLFNTIDKIQYKDQNTFFSLKQKITHPEQIWSMLLKSQSAKKAGEDVRSFFDYSHMDWENSTLSLNKNANIILGANPPFTLRNIGGALIFLFDQGIISDLIEKPSKASTLQLQFKHSYLSLKVALDALKKRIAEKTEYFEGSHVNNTQSSLTSPIATIASSNSGVSSFTTTSSEPRMQPSLLQTQMITEPLFVFCEDGFSQEFDNPHLSTIQPNDTKFRFKDVLGAIKSCQINFDQVTVKLNFQNPALSKKITAILQAEFRDKAVFLNKIDDIRHKNQNMFFFFKQKITDPEQIWSMLLKPKSTKKRGEDIRSFFDYSHIDWENSSLSLNKDANIILANDPPFTPRMINSALIPLFDKGIISDLIERPSKSIKIKLQFKHSYLSLKVALDVLKKRIAEKTKCLEGSHVNNTQSPLTSTIAASKLGASSSHVPASLPFPYFAPLLAGNSRLPSWVQPTGMSPALFSSSNSGNFPGASTSITPPRFMLPSYLTSFPIEPTIAISSPHSNDAKSVAESSARTMLDAVYFDASKFPLLNNSKETLCFEESKKLIELILTGGELEIFLHSPIFQNKQIKQNLEAIHFLIKENIALEDSQTKSSDQNIHESTLSDFLICFANLIDLNPFNWNLASDLLVFLNQNQKRVFQVFIEKIDVLEKQMEASQDAEMESSALENNFPITQESSIPSSPLIINSPFALPDANEDDMADSEEIEEVVEDDSSQEEKQTDSLNTSAFLKKTSSNNDFAFFKGKKTGNSESNEISSSPKFGKTQNENE